MKTKPTRWHISWAVLTAAVAALAMTLLLAGAAQPAQAQTFKLIYSFTGGNDGAYPIGTLSMDRAGSLYAAAYSHGAGSFGTIWRLQPKNSSWIFTPLYSFKDVAHGIFPYGVGFGPDGSLYGATNNGAHGCGVVFNIKPPPNRPASVLSPWNETVLYQLTGNADGCQSAAGVAFDQAGNIYGTTYNGGIYNDGTVFQLTRSGSGWTEKVIHTFAGSPDGSSPEGPVVFDSAGNLYGNAPYGGAGAGTIFQMSPSGNGWTFTVLTNFPDSSDGFYPYGGVMVDAAGNVYGTTSSGGTGNGGTVFMLSAGSWSFNLLRSFPNNNEGPAAPLIMDAAGNVYGVGEATGGHGYGNVFKLTPSNGGWIYTDLYNFSGGADGAYPSTNLVLDANGNIYGTAQGGGSQNCPSGCGTVFEITPLRDNSRLVTRVTSEACGQSSILLVEAAGACAAAF